MSSRTSEERLEFQAEGGPGEDVTGRGASAVALGGANHLAGLGSGVPESVGC